MNDGVVGLTPNSVLMAARADLKRHLRNLDVRLRQHRLGGLFEEYAFHRDHVRRARDAEELLALALKDRDRGTGCGKRWTRIIYADEDLLWAALSIASGVLQREGDTP